VGRRHKPKRGGGKGNPRAPESSIYTADFHAGFQVETKRLLRRRFLWLMGVLLALSVLSVGFLALIMWGAWRTGVLNAEGEDAITFSTAIARYLERGGFSADQAWVFALASAASFLYYAAAFVFVWFFRPSDKLLLRLTMAVVIADGLLAILLRQQEVPNQIGLGQFLISHFLASLFLPWTARQALIPALVVLPASALSLLMFEGHTLFNGGHVRTFTVDLDYMSIAFSPLVALPGIAVCWLRHSRRLDKYANRYVRERYGEMRRELFDARRIHEALFPPPVTEGPVRVGYTYEPMRQIGGDFLYIHRGERGRVSVVLIDVTGHGIPAALTVNRLHGELERVFAENPSVEPGEVLRLLNSYVHLTLSSHSVYVTAICFRADPEAGTLAYASGGHPPAFLRAVDGTVDQLDSTTFVLGAVPDHSFHPEPGVRPFTPGDTLIAYTDGATECRDQEGRMLGVVGIQRLVASGRVEPGHWPQAVRTMVENHRFGPVADDTLVIELTRPLQSEPKPADDARAKPATPRVSP